MISSVYMMRPDIPEQDANLTSPMIASELIPFLKSLNNINGYSFKNLIKKIVSILKTNDKDMLGFNQELIYKFIVLTCINGDINSTNQLISELLLINIPNFDFSNNTELFLNKFRQEINPFHPDSFRNSIKSTIELLKINKDQKNLVCFVNNLISIFDWDNQNKYFIRFVSNIYLSKFS